MASLEARFFESRYKSGVYGKQFLQSLLKVFVKLLLLLEIEKKIIITL